MAKLKFDDLSVDIKSLIIDRIIRPSDLKNICLVSKQLHEIAVKPLYRNVALDLGTSTDTRLPACFSPRNIGLPHIRQIRLYLAIPRDKYIYKDSSHEQQAQLVIRMILEFMPEDTLEEFSWCPWRPFSTDNLLLLYRKQRKMKCLEVMDLDWDVLPQLLKNEKMSTDVFSSARKLALYPESRETLKLSQFFVHRMADVLDELTVHANFHETPRDIRPHQDDVEPRELNDSAIAPGLLSSTIFSHMLPFEKCAPFANLKSLRLHRISLRYCADTWCKFVDFTKIEYLHLYQCTGADSLLAQMSKASNLPRQLRELEFQHKDNDENEALLALDGFLCLVSGLRYLIVDLEHVKALPAAVGIAHHGKTLELLSVHSSPESSSSSSAHTSSAEDNEELVWETEDFEKICAACTGLEQLSCAWPHTSLIRSPSEEWKSFERACGSLTNAVTLHVSTWPSNKPSTQLLPRNIYEHLLQGLAQRMFELAHSTHPHSIFSSPEEEEEEEDDPLPSHPPPPPSPSRTNDQQPPPPKKLRLLAFGISDKIFEREESKNQTIFLRSSCFDAENRRTVYAAPIGWCLRQYVEPRSDVLDFTLHREAKPPCREGRETVIGWTGEEDDFDDV